MPARGVVPAFDELKASDPRFGLGFELAAVEQFAFERREEAFAHGIVEGLCCTNGLTGFTS
jgi:hypothetical protein